MVNQIRKVRSYSPSGATDSFLSSGGKTVTVVDGLVTFITSEAFLILLETGDSILMENNDRMENA